MSFEPLQQTIREADTRWLVRNDLSEVLRIEQAAFEYPWTEEIFMKHLQQQHCMGLVIEWNQEVVGHAVYHLDDKRLHLVRLAVAPGLRRRGIGTMLLENMLRKATDQNRELLYVEVPETNLVAQKFFAAMGFTATQVLRDFYEDTDESAYRMQILPKRKQGLQPAARWTNRISGYLDSK